jgi:hypothetical protein
MDIDGNNPKQLTDSPLAEEFSDYSLDAKWVFYGKWGKREFGRFPSRAAIRFGLTTRKYKIRLSRLTGA